MRYSVYTFSEWIFCKLSKAKRETNVYRMAIHNCNLIRMGINRKTTRKDIRGTKVAVALSKTLISIQEIKENVDTNYE